MILAVFKSPELILGEMLCPSVSIIPVPPSSVCFYKFSVLDPMFTLDHAVSVFLCLADSAQCNVLKVCHVVINDRVSFYS